MKWLKLHYWIVHSRHSPKIRIALYAEVFLATFLLGLEMAQLLEDILFCIRWGS